MTKKKLHSLGALVYSTNPDLTRQEEPEQQHTPEPSAQQLRVRIEKKHRGGKTVTVVDGFEGRDEDLEELGKKLKTRCGAGGSAKEGIILVQGDYREKIVTWLKDWGYSRTKG